mgnify:CR=1 FL=1
MSTELKPGTKVSHLTTGETGRLIGPFTRKGEKWWTVYWENGETTSEPEKDIR